MHKYKKKFPVINEARLMSSYPEYYNEHCSKYDEKVFVMFDDE